ncbi:hypothetical protein GCM10009864_70190 [Streptomyces lunalinharesii]|uniref:Uncharacterized protein n=1 Tax=Streptomyces lunalinharesii TaxID=333384 RepID=A0ABP6F9X6_9ACTN
MLPITPQGSAKQAKPDIPSGWPLDTQHYAVPPAFDATVWITTARNPNDGAPPGAWARGRPVGAGRRTPCPREGERAAERRARAKGKRAARRSARSPNVRRGNGPGGDRGKAGRRPYAGRYDRIGGK